MGTHRKNRQLRPHLEPLEPRLVLSASGLVDVGSQPTGALTGKIAYTHAGHGWTADNLGSGAWTTQRPETFEMVEDLGNIDQMNFLADYLFRAGATVVPLRPVGVQTNEVVLDNDDVGVTFVGGWSDSSGSVYYGGPFDTPYRFTTSSATETAYARYQPNIPEAGFYPVYAWTKSGSNRAPDQLYRIAHTGGITEVTVNHRRVGDGLVYLGTYYFDAGTGGYVDISNRSDAAGDVVVADMIRFGNGMGDINRGGGVSGKPRADEAGLYWVKWHVDRSQGIPDSEYRTSSSDRTATVSLSPRYAEFMNNAGDGSLSDRVFVSFHSNAGGGSARGVLGLYNGNNTPSSATPNQFLLANTLGREVNDDLVLQNGQYEHSWFNRTTVTLDRSDIEFGEINNTYINGEFDATIIETGFHDNQQDAEMLRDPRVRDAIARATYQGIVKYFNDVDGGSTPLVMAPAAPTRLRVIPAGTGNAIVSWQRPEFNEYVGDGPLGYRVYTSTDGYGFDGGTYVDGLNTTSAFIPGLDPAQGVHYFKVAAVNAGGESPATPVLAAAPIMADTSVLIVDGFERFDRFLNPREAYFAGQIDRVKPRFSNSFDYSVQAGAAVEAYSSTVAVAGASSAAVAAGDISLANYDAVIWLSGEESSANDTFNATEQTLVASYLAQSGKLFVSGAEIGWDLDNLDNGRAFYENDLKANYVADDANTYTVQGVGGSIFDGLTFSFDDGSQFYDSQFPDVINPNAGSSSALVYMGGTGGGAATTFGDAMGEGQIVNFGFPFETITTVANRANVMERVLDFFFPETALIGDFNNNGEYECSDVDGLVAAIVDVKNGNSADLTFDLTGDNNVNNADLDLWLAVAGAAGLTASGNPVLYGDANLSGTVDAADYQIWTANKFTLSAAWCTADFNADGAVDGADLLLWNANKFTTPDAIVRPTPTSTDIDGVRMRTKPIHLTLAPEIESAKTASRQMPSRWPAAAKDDTVGVPRSHLRSAAVQAARHGTVDAFFDTFAGKRVRRPEVW